MIFSTKLINILSFLFSLEHSEYKKILKFDVKPIRKISAKFVMDGKGRLVNGINMKFIQPLYMR